MVRNAEHGPPEVGGHAGVGQPSCSGGSLPRRTVVATWQGEESRLPPVSHPRSRPARGGGGALSQMVAAEQIGISRAYLAQVERGREPAPALATKLERWLAGGG
jgi:Helix-turn-helix